MSISFAPASSASSSSFSVRNEKVKSPIIRVFEHAIGYSFTHSFWLDLVINSLKCEKENSFQNTWQKQPDLRRKVEYLGDAILAFTTSTMTARGLIMPIEEGRLRSNLLIAPLALLVPTKLRWRKENTKGPFKSDGKISETLFGAVALDSSIFSACSLTMQVVGLLDHKFANVSFCIPKTCTEMMTLQMCRSLIEIIVREQALREVPHLNIKNFDIWCRKKVLLATKQSVHELSFKLKLQRLLQDLEGGQRLYL